MSPARADRACVQHLLHAGWAESCAGCWGSEPEQAEGCQRGHAACSGAQLPLEHSTPTPLLQFQKNPPAQAVTEALSGGCSTLVRKSLTQLTSLLQHLHLVAHRENCTFPPKQPIPWRTRTVPQNPRPNSDSCTLGDHSPQHKPLPVGWLSLQIFHLNGNNDDNYHSYYCFAD